MAELIGPRPASTPRELRASRASARGIPLDILRDASRRLGMLALITAALWIAAEVLGHAVAHVATGGREPWLGRDVTTLISAVSIVASLALYAYTRVSRRSPQFVLDLGLVYMVIVAATLGLMFHWTPVPRDFPIYPQVSWIGVTVLLFAAVLPNAPWKVFIASLIAAAMAPLGMAVARARGSWPYEPAWAALVMHYPDFLLAGAAWAVAHVVTRLGREVSRAREMGSYHLGELIGKGGMGEVYRATHRMLARPAAIKLIRPEMLGRGDSEATELAIKRFRREAEAAANLRSPHTVEIYDFGETDDGTVYFVMELLQGMDLETLVREHGPVPPARVVHVLRQVCASLEEAHAAGLVHRDIKPANIFVGRVGLQCDFVKVLDFGLVKPTAAIGRPQTVATAEGLTPGTPAYMAPEMALGEAVDGRADIYALGCVAYFLLTGELVFEADNPLQMLARHLQTPPTPPSQRTAAPIPPALDALVLQCLAKEPAQRPDAATLRRALRTVDAGPWDEEQAVRWWSEAVAPRPPRPSVAALLA